MFWLMFVPSPFLWLECPEFCHFGSVEVDAVHESTYEFPSKSIDKDYIYSNRQNELEGIDRSHSEIRTISFEEWQKEASNKWATYTTSECDCSTWQQGTSMSNTNENSQKIGTGCSQDRYNTSYMSYNTKKTSASSSTKKETRTVELLAQEATLPGRIHPILF